VRPAVNVGISVSRVGGNAQIKAMKQVAGTLRLDLAQYRNLAAFAQFGSDLDKASQAQLARGQRMTELLKQPQFQPMPVELQIASIYAGTKGAMDSLKVESVREFEAGLHEHLKSKSKEILSAIVATGKLEKATEEALWAAIQEFKDRFVKENAGAQAA
jgi:F-type H+-transporting ATPase subunit alpha